MISNETQQSLRWLRIAGAAAIFFHVLGLFAALLGIRYGTPVYAVGERMAHIHTSFYGWKVAWGIWMIAAGTFVWFLATVDKVWNPIGTCARFSIAIGVVAASLDSTFDTIQIAVLPAVASRGPEARTFLGLADFANAGGIIVANGLYAISVALITAALGDRISKVARWMGWAVLVTGLALSAAGFFDNPHFPEIFTGPAIGSYILWIAALAWKGPKMEMATVG